MALAKSLSCDVSLASTCSSKTLQALFAGGLLGMNLLGQPCLVAFHDVGVQVQRLRMFVQLAAMVVEDVAGMLKRPDNGALETGVGDACTRTESDASPSCRTARRRSARPGLRGFSCPVWRLPSSSESDFVSQVQYFAATRNGGRHACCRAHALHDRLRQSEVGSLYFECWLGYGCRRRRKHQQ